MRGLACSVAEGREPWGGAPVLPSLEIGDHEAGIWALSVDGHGRTLVTGTEDGSVAAWDLRSRACIWQVSRPATSCKNPTCNAPCHKGRR